MGVGIREWGMGIGGSGSGLGSGSGSGSGAVGGQQAAIWLISVKMNVYKRGCEKMVIIFSQPLFHILYQLVRDLMGAGIFPPRLMNSSARNLLISRTGA